MNQFKCKDCGRIYRSNQKLCKVSCPLCGSKNYVILKLVSVD